MINDRRKAVFLRGLIMAKKVNGSGTSFRGNTGGAAGNARKRQFAQAQNRKALSGGGKGG
ncbi:MAG: hypothetical protein D8G53_15305 [Candidatus Saccharimonas sp.]|nr:MAG: hypothetical protein D8G53_15305 [Candidatus Saccharimonas sp.]